MSILVISVVVPIAGLLAAWLVVALLKRWARRLAYYHPRFFALLGYFVMTLAIVLVVGGPVVFHREKIVYAEGFVIALTIVLIWVFHILYQRWQWLILNELTISKEPLSAEQVAENLGMYKQPIKQHFERWAAEGVLDVHYLFCEFELTPNGNEFLNRLSSYKARFRLGVGLFTADAVCVLVTQTDFVGQLMAGVKLAFS